MENVVVIIVGTRDTNKLHDVLEIESYNVKDLYDLYGMPYSEEFLDIELTEKDFQFLAEQIPVLPDFSKYRYYIGICSRSGDIKDENLKAVAESS